jgi:hypothetical protein
MITRQDRLVFIPPKLKVEHMDDIVKKRRSSSTSSASSSSSPTPRTSSSKRQRSRFGCEECKSRRVKCDEFKPKCSRCTEKGISCNYKILLQFREDLEVKGRKFGREGVWTKEGTSKNTSKHLSLQSRSSHYQPVRNSDALRFINVHYRDIIRESHTLRRCLQPSIIPVDIRTNLSDDILNLSFALNYYIDFISPILNPVGRENIYYNQVLQYLNRNIVIESGLDFSSLIKYSQDQNHLFYMMLSLGSIYISKSHGIASKKDWRSRARYFQEMAIKGVENQFPRSVPTIESVGDDIINGDLNFETNGDVIPFGTESLGSIGDDLTFSTVGNLTYVDEIPFHPDDLTFATSLTNISFRTDSLLSLVLLMLYELANDCDENWTLYLKKCKKLLDTEKFVFPHNSMEHTLLLFALEFLDYQESIGRTACKDVNSFFLLAAKKDEDISVIDEGVNPQITLVSWMGCDRRLMSIISDITDLSFERESRQISEASYLALAEGIRIRIEQLSLNMFDKLIELSSKKDFVNSLNTHLEILGMDMDHEEFCFLLACEVKRIAVLIYLECCLLNKSPEDLSISNYVRFIFKVLEFVVLENDFKWYSTVLWTTYIASAEISNISVECEDLRYLTLKILDRIEQNSLGNAGKARRIILDIWKKRDLNDHDENSMGVLKKNELIKQNKEIYLGVRNDWDRNVVDKTCCLSLS